MLVETIQTVTACAELTGLQKVAGFVSWMNILRVLAIVGGVVSAGYLLIKWFSWLIDIFLLIPKEVYEFLGYTASIALIVWSHWISQTNQLWPLLGGSLLFGVMLIATGMLHKLKPNPERFFSVLFVVWAGVAYYFQSNVIGFITAGALLCALGFSAAVLPFGYVIGFRNKAGLARGTSAGFILLAIFVAARIVGNKSSFQIFESGALWLGAFSGYLGMLIASSRYHTGDRASYIVMQIITIILGFAAIGIGSIFDIQPLRGIGGTFFVLYLIEKPFEIPDKSLTELAFIGLAVSAVVGTGVWWAQNHMDVVRPYLLF